MRACLWRYSEEAEWKPLLAAFPILFIGRLAVGVLTQLPRPQGCMELSVDWLVLPSAGCRVGGVSDGLRANERR